MNILSLVIGIVSLVVGIVSIVLAVVAMDSSKKAEQQSQHNFEKTQELLKQNYEAIATKFINVDEEKIKLIRIFGGTKRQVLTKVVFPSNIPCILNTLKINVGLSFVGVIVGEFLVAQKGLGFLITYNSQTFKTSIPQTNMPYFILFRSIEK